MTDLSATLATLASRVPLAARFVLTLSFMVLVLILSVTPDQAIEGDSVFVWLVVTTPKLLQKSLHLLVYAALAVMWFWTLVLVASARMSRFVALLVAVAFGAVLEWWQTFVPGRFGSLYDLVLNGVGATFGALLAHAVIMPWLAKAEDD